MGEVSEELKEIVQKKEKEFYIWLVGACVFNLIIGIFELVFYTNGILWIISWINLGLGVLGTVFVGIANFNSGKTIIGYSSTKVGYNPDIVNMLLNAK